MQFSAYVQPCQRDRRTGICGLTRPLHVTALLGGTVKLNTRATLDCSMVAELESWLTDVVQPAAMALSASRWRRSIPMGAYACRGMNNQIGARISEHAFGNAIDIGGFCARRRPLHRHHSATGRVATSRPAFLREAQGGAATGSPPFAPGSNAFHYDHIPRRPRHARYSVARPATHLQTVAEGRDRAAQARRFARRARISRKRPTLRR